MAPSVSKIESSAKRLAGTVGFELLGEGLGRDMKSALKTALAGGAVFHGGRQPLALFRNAVVGVSMPLAFARPVRNFS